MSWMDGKMDWVLYPEDAAAKHEENEPIREKFRERWEHCNDPAWKKLLRGLGLWWGE